MGCAYLFVGRADRVPTRTNDPAVHAWAVCLDALLELDRGNPGACLYVHVRASDTSVCVLV